MDNNFLISNTIVSRELQLDLSQLDLVVKIELFNGDGSLVVLEYANGGSSTTVPLDDDLPAGEYFVRVKDMTTSYMQRITLL